MGDREDIEAVRSRIEGVRSLARRLVRDAAAADDAVQDAIVAALGHPRGLTGASDAWLRRAVRHRIIDGRRANAARRDRERASGRAKMAREVGDSAERHRELASLVIDLPEPYRSTITMRFFDDLSPREIAARSGRTPAAIKKQIHRGLEMLRARLRERHGDDRVWAVALLPVLGTRRAALGLLSGPMLGLAAAGTLIVGGAVIVMAGEGGHRSQPDDLRTASVGALVEAETGGLDGSTLAPIAGRAVRTAAPKPAPREQEVEADVVTIRGRFVDERGAPIVGAVATWLDPTTEFGGVTGADGELELRCPPWSVEVAVLGVEDGVHAPARFDWRGVPRDREIDLGQQKLYDPATVDVQVVRDGQGPVARGWTVTVSDHALNPCRGPARTRGHRSTHVRRRRPSSG